MQFLKALFPSFYVWQIFSLSPFSLVKDSLTPKCKRIHNCMTIVSVIIQFAVLIHGFFDLSYVNHSHHLILLSMGDIVLMTLVRCTSISIVLESWWKRPLHIAFLTKIHQIDTILTSKLQIDLKYETQQKKHFNIFIVFVVCYLSASASVMAVSIIAELPPFQLFWTLYIIPLFVCMMRYQQFTSYVHLMHDRYKAINDHMERSMIIKPYHGSTPNDTQNLKNVVHIVHSQKFKRNRIDDIDVEAFLVVNQLKHIQRVHRLLYESNKILCRAFRWSMLLNVCNDFVNILINYYWFTTNLITGDSKVQLVGAFSWSSINIILLVSLSNACEIASHEVISLLTTNYSHV